MSQINLGALLLVLSFSIGVHAKDVPWIGLPEHGDFQDMSKENRSLYVHGLHVLSTKLGELHAKKFKYPRKRKPASQAQTHCDYAGNFLQIPESGVCPPPAACPISPGLVQCWPDLFGENVCVAPGPNTDMKCRENARPASTIAERYRKDPESWARLQANLGEYCGTGLEDDSCRVIRDQVYEINELVGYQTPPPADQIVTNPGSSGGRKTVAYQGPRRDELSELGSAKGRVSKRAKSAGNDVNQTDTPASRDQAQEEAAQAAEENVAKPECNTAQLIVAIECKTENGPESILSPSEAQDIFCARKKITKEEERIINLRITRMSACLRSLPTIASSAAQRYEVSRATLLRETHEKSQAAFATCVKELKLGTTPEVGAATSRGNLIRAQDGMVSLSATTNSPKGWRLHEKQVGQVLVSEKISLCTLRLSGFPSGNVHDSATDAKAGNR